MKSYLGRIVEQFRKCVFGLRRTIVFEAPCVSEPDILPKEELVSFRRGGAADLKALEGPANGYGQSDSAFCRGRLAAGDALWIGSLQGRPVFSAWVMSGQMDLEWDNMLRLRPEIAYSYKLFTVESVRGQRICGAYYDFLLHHLSRAGYRRLVCRIAPGNASSIRAHTRAGFRRVGMLWRLAIGPYAIYFADESLRLWLHTALAEQCANPAGYYAAAGRILGVF